MNNLFGNAATELAGAEKEKDVLGGRRLFPTDAYEGDIEVVYITKSAGGATAFNLVVDINGQKFQDQVYVTNKQGGVTYTDKNDKKHPLPGYSLMNALCKLTIGKEIPNLTFEKKIVKIYNYELKKDVATEVDVAVELTGEKVCLGIELVRENKNVKDQTGTYVATAETRDSNQLARVFHVKTGHTVAEYDAQEQPTFKNLWLTEYKGKMRDRSKAGSAAPAAAGASAATTTGAKPSLFGSK